MVDKQPNYGNSRPLRMKKMLNLIRGPEEVHTDLLYKGYGVKVCNKFKSNKNHTHSIPVVHVFFILNCVLRKFIFLT